VALTFFLAEPADPAAPRIVRPMSPQHLARLLDEAARER
jgi:hypothetical protein